MSALVAGPCKGSAVRTARKSGRCHFWLGFDGRCQHVIAPGEPYVEGDMLEGGNPHARQRWCLTHFTPEELP